MNGDADVFGGKQKWSSCSWLLMREFVKRRQAMEKEREEKIANGEKHVPELQLPTIPYVRLLCSSVS